MKIPHFLTLCQYSIDSCIIREIFETLDSSHCFAFIILHQERNLIFGLVAFKPSVQRMMHFLDYQDKQCQDYTTCHYC